MSILIDELKRDHAAMVEVLNDVNRLGISTKEGNAKLLSAKSFFLAHLKKEDSELYPALRKAQDSDARQAVELFTKDMDAISKTALEFFDRYASGGSGLDFARDFGKLFATLKIRAGKEERSLYPLYDRQAC